VRLQGRRVNTQIYLFHFRNRITFLLHPSADALLLAPNWASGIIRRLCKRYEVRCMDTRIELAIKIMHVESLENVPICQLARRVNLSPWHFAHLFKRETSRSTKQYVRDLKIRRAQDLLGSTFLSVKEIAAKVGFGDRSHFSRDFKKLCGQNPSAFRAGRKASAH
jgi:transcriptional regulator GlxA family with amidase domain